MHRQAVLFFLLLTCISGSAQFRNDYNFQFKQYSAADGLADNAVIKCVKDKHGFLWIATLNGISRFDGSTFKNYSPQDAAGSGLRSGWTSDILIDEQQQLWVSTEGGVCYYDEASDKFIYINAPNQLQLIFKMPLANGGTHTLWVVAEDGLRKIDTRTKKYSPTSLRRIIDPQFVSTTAGNRLLIGTRGHGLWEYDITSDTYKRFSLPGLPEATHFMGTMAAGSGTWIACSEGLIWLTAEGHYDLFNRAQNSGEPADALMCVSPFNKAFGNRYLLCGSYDQKLRLFDTQTKLFCYQWQSSYANPAGFTSAILNHLFSDGDLLWISGNRGLQLLNLKAQQQHSYFIEGLHDAGQSVLVKKAIPHSEAGRQEVWMIPLQPVNGLLQYDLLTKKTLQHFNGRNTKNSMRYFDVMGSAFNNEIIAAGDGRLDVFSSNAGMRYSIKVDGNIRCIAENSRGDWWLGLDDGIAFIERLSKKVQKFSHSYQGSDLENNTIGGSFPVYDIKVVNDSIIYLSNLKYGLFDFNANSRQFSAHRIPTNASFSTANRSVALVFDNRDTMYTGTYDGLAAYNISRKNFKANITKALPGPIYIYSLVKDSNNRVWARTNNGLLGYEPATGKLFSFKIKGEPDISNFQQKLSMYGSDHILMGHEGGFSILNISALTDQHFSPPSLYMNKVLLNNKELFFTRDDSVVWKFTYLENQLSFQAAAVEYNNPEGILYYYKLEGLDTAWKEGGNKNSFNYNFLPHGKYRFCIYARNSINHTQSPVLYFPFAITPAWWQHWWWWPLLAVLFAALVLWIARRRIRIIRRREAQQTRQNKLVAELELKMLRSQMNPHFIFNSLNSIQKYIWENKEEDAAEYLARFAKLMRAILELSRHEFVSLKEEASVLKLYIELEHRRSNGSFEYNVHIDENLDQDKTLVPPMIMQPFIENAIWHGLNKKGSKGHLQVSVKKINDQLVCEIADDGNGFDLNKPVIKEGQASLGIEITRQRLERLMHNTGLRSEVSIHSTREGNGERPAGTTVTIYLPLQTI